MLLEIRTYSVVPGRAEEFVELMRAEALPLLAAAGVDVVACRASLDAGDEGEHEVYLLRAFADSAERAREEDAFYGSTAWVDGPRARVMALIRHHHTVTIELPAAGIDALREQR